MIPASSDGADVKAPEREDRPRRGTVRPPGAGRAEGQPAAKDLLARFGPYALVVAVVVVANSLYLFGVFDPNPVLSMSGLPLVAKAGVLAGRFTIDPNVGTTAQSLGHLAALDLLHGTLPWWNPYEGLGAPLAGEMQSAAFFPPNLLLALGGAQGQLLFHMLLEAVAGMATYRLLSRLGVSRWVAAAGGCAFALNGTYAWFMHAPVNPVAFLPLLLLGVERARAAAAEGRGGSYALVGVALALSIYAGFPEVTYLDGVFAVVWTAVRVQGLDRRALLRYARKVAVGVGTGLLLAAPILVAFGDYLHAAYLGPHGGGYDALSIPGTGVSTLFFPYAAGPIFGFTPAETSGVLGTVWIDVGGYLTTTILVLAVIGLWSRRLRALRVGLAVWTVIALGRAYGVGPFQRLFDVLPIMNRVEVYRYVTPSIELACMVLAVLAVDDLRRRDVPLWYVGSAVVASAACAVVTVEAGHTLFHAVADAPQSHAWLAGSLAWGFGTLVVVGAGAFLLRGRLRAGVLTGLVVVEACAMFVVPQLSAPRSGRIDTAFVHWAATHTRTARVFTFGGLLNPNFGSYFDIAEADVNDLPMPKAYERLIVHELDPSTIPNHFDGTTTVPRHLVPGAAPGPTETPLQAFTAGVRRYEAIGVRYVVAYTGSADAAGLASLGLTRVYADRHAQVYRLPRPAPMYSAPGCTLSHERIDSVTVDCRRPAVLVRRELSMAGWSATAGGRRLAVHRHGAVFQSVTLGTGRAGVRFAFTPPHEEAALAALLAGLLALAASLALANLRNLAKLANVGNLGNLPAASATRRRSRRTGPARRRLHARTSRS